MKIPLAVLSFLFLITLYGCTHDPVKKDPAPEYKDTSGKAPGAMEKISRNEQSGESKHTDLPDIQLEDLTVKDEKKRWTSPVSIDYRHYEKGSPLRLVVQNSHSDKINDLAVSPDGRIIVTASKDGKIKIWNIDGILLKTIRHPGEWIRRLIITPDGRRFAASMKNRLMVWRIDGRLQSTFKGKDYDIRDISMSGDGKRIVTCNGKRFFDIRDRNFRLMKRIETGFDIDRVAFSPGGKLIATGGSLYRTSEGWGSYSALWNGRGKFIMHLDIKGTGTGERFRKREITKPLGDIKWIIFSPDSRYIATVGERHYINIRKTDGELVNSIKFVFVKSCFFSHDSRELITSGSHDIKIFDFDGREKLSIYMRSKDERGNVVSCFGMTPDGQKLVTGFSYPVSGLVRIWNRKGRMTGSLGKRSREFQRILLDPGYKKIILEPNKKKNISFVWHLKNNSIKELDERIGFYDDGTEYFYYYGRYNVFKIRGSRGSGKFKTKYGTGVLPLADGRIARWNPFVGVFAAGRGSVVIHDLKENPVKRIKYRHYSTSGIGGPFHYGTEFSPDGKYFLIESYTNHGGRNFVSLMDMKGKKIRELNVETDPSTAAVSLDGDYIAAGNKDGSIRIWARNGKKIRKIEEISVKINSLFFSGGNRYLASTSRDRTIRLWKIKTGKHVAIQLFKDDRWIVYNESMRYDASPGGREYLAFVRGLTPYSGAEVEKKYRMPGLLTRFYR
jgi:WD40 repeat protein